MTPCGNALAAVAVPRALAASVAVTVVQSGDWRTKATGGFTAPAPASVTRPLRLRATVLRESSAERYPTGGVTAGRVSIVNVGPDVAVAGEKVSGVVVVLGRSSPSMRTVSSAVIAPPVPVVMREIPKVAVLMVVGSSPPASTSPVPEPAGQAAAKSVAAAQPLAVAAVPAT